MMTKRGLKRGFILVATIAAVGNLPAAAQPSRRIAGHAAYYDVGYKGITTSGAAYDPEKFTAAHRTLPFGTRVKVTDRKTGRSVVVTINDRGPFNKRPNIDLSLAAARKLGMIRRGIVAVSLEIE